MTSTTVVTGGVPLNTTPLGVGEAIASGVSGAGLGLVFGSVVDEIFPAYTPATDPLMALVELLAQLALNAVLVSKLNDVVLTRVDPMQETSVLFYAGFLTSQPNMRNKLLALSVRVKTAFVDFMIGARGAVSGTGGVPVPDTAANAASSDAAKHESVM